MTGTYSGKIIYKLLVSTGIMLICVRFLFSCAGDSGLVRQTEKEKAQISMLVVASPQDAIYNGKAQPLSFTYAGGERVDVIYYPSFEAREGGIYGSFAAPVQAGTYYVSVSIPEEEVYAEYRIHRCPVKIDAAEIQNAFYNGNPKRVTAEAEPPVPLSFSYYPKREFRDAAAAAAANAAANAKGEVSPGDASVSLNMNFSGYKRVGRAPIEQGTYYVWIYFPGDSNHEAAQAYVEFSILPPK